MRVELNDITIGDRTVVSFIKDVIYSSTVLEVDLNRQLFRGDYLDERGRHRRDKWIRISSVILCERSDMKPSVINIILQTLKHP